ncbi:MAG: glycosyltransferase family 39 protein [Burkholderiaceae bacterium]|nr:MAG: glycosyltransferase family 39 protein [Burkholderiaceae bacterium]
MATVSSADAPRTGAPRRFWLWFGLLATLLLALSAARPLSVPDEGRYADISRWMLVSGDWLVPRLDGLPFFHKPPLTHWLQAISMAVFGVSPWSARVPGVLLALLMVAVVYRVVRDLGGRALAGRAAFMLGASGMVLIGAQYVNHDIGVAAWITVAIACFARSFAEEFRPHAGWACAGFLACALGLLTKGLIGVALPGLALFIWVTWTHQWRKVWRLPWGRGLALFVVVAVPWFVLIAWRFRGAFEYLFGVQQFDRYIDTGFNNRQPWWFFLAAVALLLAPWIVFAVLEAAGQIRERWTRVRRTPSNRWVALCWIWFIAILVFFSIPRSKLIGYIFPAIPPLAILAALGWQRTMAGRPRAVLWFGVLAAIPIVLSTALTLGFPYIDRQPVARDVGLELRCRLAPSDVVLVTGGYPFDLPFVARTRKPLVVLDDWPQLRKTEHDTWRRELFEAGDFQPGLASEVLRSPDLVQKDAHAPGYWLVQRADKGAQNIPAPAGWNLVFQGRAWRLFRSTPAEGTAEPVAGAPKRGCSEAASAHAKTNG